MTLLMKISSDKIKRIWDSSGSFNKKTGSVSVTAKAKGLFNKFYVNDGTKKCRNPKFKRFKAQRVDETEMWLLKNHKDRALDFKNIQKLSSSLQALQGWLSALSVSPPPKDPPAPVPSSPPVISHQKGEYRRSYSAVVQGIDPNNAVTSPKSVESIFPNGETSTSSSVSKTTSSSSESDAPDADPAPSLSPRMLPFSPKNRFVPYEQRNSSSPLLEALQTRAPPFCAQTQGYNNINAAPVVQEENNGDLRKEQRVEKGGQEFFCNNNAAPKFQIQMQNQKMQRASHLNQRIPSYPFAIAALPLARNVTFLPQPTAPLQNTNAPLQNTNAPQNFYPINNNNKQYWNVQKPIYANNNNSSGNSKPKDVQKLVICPKEWRVLNRGTKEVGKMISSSDLERQALEQYSSSHESIVFRYLEKQGAEQYDDDDVSSENSENSVSPPMIPFGGQLRSSRVLLPGDFCEASPPKWPANGLNDKPTLLLVPVG